MAAADRPLRVALVGFGTMGEARARLYATMAKVELVGIADPTRERRQRATALLPEMPVYRSLVQLLRRTEAEVLDICSPPVGHAVQIRLGLEHGCHVLCEKPLVTRAADLPALVELARSVGRVLYPAHNYRFSPAMRFLHAALEDGTLGTPEQGEVRIARTAHARGVVEWIPDWRRDAGIAGGGILADHGTHTIYMASWLSGAWPHAVRCRIDGNGAAEARAWLQLLVGRIRWTIDLTWNGAARHSYYSLTGSAGSAVVDDDHARLLPGPGSAVDLLCSAAHDSTHSAWFPSLFNDFRESLSDEPSRRRSLADGLATMFTLDQAYASAGNGEGWLAIDLPALCHDTPPPTAWKQS